MTKTRETHPQKIEQDMLSQQVGDELLLYDEERHQAFCLNPVCALVWTLCDGKNSLSEIATVAGSHLNIALDEQIVMLAIQELRKDGLVKAQEAAIPVPAISRRDLMQRLGAGAVMLIPAVVAIAPPTAAQAYSGCFDCDVRSPHSRPAKAN